VSIDYFDKLERSTCLRINALSRWKMIRSLFGAVSRLGDYPAYVVVGLICVFYPGVNGPVLAIHAALTGLVGLVVYKLLKTRLVRERPFVRFGEIVCGAAPLDRYSFPSGHTLHAVSFAIVYSSHVPQMLWVLAPFAALVAMSRVILGLHYPTDVIIGAAIGATLGLASLEISPLLV
jgi:undecaprenyl-diphosphatase